MKKQTVSLCMIVKDEEKTLPRCLESVRDLVDEIIVVDTGSTDRTVEIAKLYGAKVYYFKWCDDFSAARNETFKYATKEWIFSIDADEYIDEENKAKLKKLLQNPTHDAYGIRIKNFLSSYTPAFDINILFRLYRNIPGLYYTGKIHNQIEESLIKLGLKLQITDIFLYHTGYLGDAPQRKRGRLKILREWYKREPDNYLVNFYIGAKYHSLGMESSAIKHFRKVINSKSAEPHFRRFSHIYLIHAFIEKKLPDSVLKWCGRGFKLYPQEPAFHIFAAQAYFLKKEYTDAIKELKYALKKCSSVHPGLFYMEITAPVIYAMFGEVYEALGIIEKSISHYSKAIELDQNYLMPWLKLGRIYENQLQVTSDNSHLAIRQANIEKAIDCYKNAIRIDPTNITGLFNLGNLLLSKGVQLNSSTIFKEASECFRKVILLSPSNLEAHNNLGFTYMLQNLYEDAIICFKKALKLNPDSIPALKNLALCYQKLGKEEQAIPVFAKAKELGG